MNTKLKQIVNLTPHEIVLCGLIIKPSGTVARAKEYVTHVKTYEHKGRVIPVISKQFGEVHDLPDPEPDTIYIVSLPTAMATRGKRTDVFIVGDVIRDIKGNVIGASSLGVVE